MRSYRSAVVALVALSVSPAVAQTAATAELAIKFGERESFFGAAISPDGSKVTYITPISGRGNALMIADTTTGEVKPVMSTGDSNISLRRCYWAKADRLICAIYAVTDALGSDLIGVRRLYSVSPDGKDIKEIGRRLGAKSIGVNQDSGSVISILPDHPDDVLMSVWNDEKESIGSNIRPRPPGLAVQRVNIRNGRMQFVEQPLRDGEEFIADAQGRPRVRGIAERRDGADYAVTLTGNVRYAYRAPNGGDWMPLFSYDASAGSVPVALDFDLTGQWLYMLKPQDGRVAAVRFATDGSKREELVYAHPTADIDGLIQIGKFDRPIGLTYSTDFNHIHYLDADLAALSGRLQKALPGSPEVSILDETWDGQKLLIHAGSDVDPGAYYIYDKAAKRLGKLSSTRPKLEGMALATQKPVTFAARDGTAIPGYLTTPPGKEAKGLPLIVMPHGGPSARDTWGFDWLPQYFAQLGYAVIQPNYRGSSGYGDVWYGEDGFKAWRTAMSDVNDSARWAIAQGIADPKKVAIVGWSYGGYAALQTNVIEPGLYRAAVAIAPLTDMQMWKAEFRGFINRTVQAEYIGSGPHLVEGSPLRNAAAIKVPVMLFHGTRDINVGVAQSEAMASALRNAGGQVELVTYKNLDHQLADSAARADMLLKSARFLEANLK
jgi:dipeptidyl aminopeptidase/acylaminoacyl peptidase